MMTPEQMAQLAEAIAGIARVLAEEARKRRDDAPAPIVVVLDGGEPDLAARLELAKLECLVGLQAAGGSDDVIREQIATTVRRLAQRGVRVSMETLQ
jgi:hypothetical protein